MTRDSAMFRDSSRSRPRGTGRACNGASACGLAHLLTRCAGVSATAAYGGIIGRAENKAMLKVLHLGIQPVSRIEHQPRDLICLVDTQPEVGNYSLASSELPQLVIDHH